MKSNSGPPRRVAFVGTHPIQYTAPLFAYLTSECNLHVTALYLSDFSIKGGVDPGFKQTVKWDVDLLKGYDVRFIKGFERRERIGGFFSMIAPGLWGEIRKGNFDAVVIHGHNLAAHHLALCAARSCGAIVLQRSETHGRLKRSKIREAIRKPLLAAWYNAFDGFLAIGSANARYYRAMGVPEEVVSLMPYAVDNDRFAEGVTGAPEDVRLRFGLTDQDPVILYASKFDRRKRPDDLLAAVSVLQREGVAVQLLLVGAGAMEAELRNIVKTKNIKKVSFTGFINQQDLPSVYNACDVFVLPSENEPWGLVVNEAMCAGLPVVLSEEIGCAEDLVRPGENGATFPAGDITALANALRPILIDGEMRKRLGRASSKLIANWSYRECGYGLRDAITRAETRRAEHP